MTKRQLRKQLKEFSHKTEPSTTLYSGALGIYIGGHQYVDVPNRPGFVYVRLRNNTSELIQAHNEVVSPVYGLPVILVRNKTYYEIYGRDSVQYASYWDTNSSYLPKHGSQHEFDPDNNGGGDLVFVHGEQFYPMMTFPSGTDGADTVLIAPYRYYYSSAWHYTGNTGVGNLLTYGPTGANNATLLLVGIDASTGNPFVKVGSEFDASITGAAALTDYVPTSITPSTEIPGAIIRLVTGTSTITWANIYDARQYMGILQAAGGATTFLGLTDTPSSYAGQANKLLVVNAAESGVEFRTNTGSFGGGGGPSIFGIITGSEVDDWTLAGFSTASIIDVLVTGTASALLTGLAGGTAGKQITLKNNGLVGTVILWSNTASSSANQFNLPKTYMSLEPGDSISLTYDDVYQKWYPLEANRGFVNEVYLRTWELVGLQTGTTNNWSSYKFKENSVIRVMPSGTAIVTGITQSNTMPHGQQLTFVNIGSDNILFKNEDSNSTSYNRLSLPDDINLSPKGSVTFIYDGTFSNTPSRWRSLDYSTTGTSTGNSGGGPLTILRDFGGLTAGENNNYNPTGYDANTDVIAVFGDAGGTSTITGLVGGTEGRVITITNIGGYKVALDNQGTSSSAGNRFEFNGIESRTLYYGESITLYYDNDFNQVWYPMDMRKENDALFLNAAFTYGITGSITDWNNFNLQYNSVFLLNSSGTYDIGGIYYIGNSFNEPSQVLTFVNIGSNTLTFKNEDGASTAAYRFSMGNDVQLSPGKSLVLWYDNDNSRWRNIARAATTIYPRIGEPIPLTSITGTYWKVPDGAYVTGSLALFDNGLLKLVGTDYSEQYAISGTYQYVTVPATGTTHSVMYGVSS